MTGRQRSLGEKSPEFDQDLLTVRRSESLRDVFHDACIARFGDLETAAEALNRAFAPEGRPVSGASLRVAIRQKERNYWRGEWIAIIADHPLFQAWLTSLRMTPEQENAAMREYFATEAPGILRGFDRKVQR